MWVLIYYIFAYQQLFAYMTFSAPLSAEPSSTQSEVVENGVDKSASEDSPDPSHSQATVRESDLSEQQSEREESAEEKNDPVSSSSSKNSSDGGVSSADTRSACPSSSTEPAGEGSTTAEITSDSSETADDTMEQDWGVVDFYTLLYKHPKNHLSCKFSRSFIDQERRASGDVLKDLSWKHLLLMTLLRASWLNMGSTSKTGSSSFRWFRGAFAIE